MQEYSDYQLILLIKQKKQEALSELYDRYAALVYSFSCRSLHQEEGAREVVQSVFVRIWTTEAEFDPDKGQFRNWILTITRNLTIDWLRKQRSQSSKVVSYDTVKKLESVAEHTELSVENQVEKQLLKEQIQGMRAFLSQQQLELLEHFYWQGYSLSELAAHYQEPLGTVKSRLHQTLKILRKHLLAGGDGW
ncbi:DNA-directed RNA polymerase sigma-70 factor [Paenibacillus silvae]|uniref:DNA-directed RNA polymerase sigma-70 factor n=1 Tax=Paenibacillus silvae TaxID=1325358 RepID=A0ABQ1ZHN7_9BACL|nr:sigma-70 family RNA polymerase sigma factor [Paenibacillus silvae]GGH62500.1 DNA-directed RNA polymerase sigma-70 factor [Paenibacillus silvae]